MLHPKVAVTATEPAALTAQLPLPVHAPDHAVKELPLSAVAVIVTAVFAGKFVVHVVVQLEPPGLKETDPLPVPAKVTVIEAVPDDPSDASEAAASVLTWTSF